MNRTVDVVVGLQFGSEGKGAVCARMAHMYDGAVRTGAPNAGHTVIHEGKTFKMRSIPCAWVNPRLRLFIGPGGMVNLHVLSKEGEALGADVLARLKIDRNAWVITDADIKREEDEPMNKRNGSTAEGVGVAQARKVLRRGESTLAGQIAELAPYITDVSGELLDMIRQGLTIQLEGTQGFGLCVNHGSYPFVTSRDVLSASLLSDAGLPPTCVRNVYGVMRTYPIRVAGNSGPMFAPELTWDEVSRRCGAPAGSISERTTVTNRVRRVSEIDWSMLQRSVKMNGVEGIFITFIDYIDWRMHGVTDWGSINRAGREFIGLAESYLSVPILGVGTGPKPSDMVLTPYGRKTFGEHHTLAVA